MSEPTSHDHLLESSPRAAAFSALAATVVLLAACAGGPGPRDVASPARSATPPTSPAELIRLHETVRVAGLEDRRFGHAAFWSAVEPYLGDGFDVATAGASAEGREVRRIRYGSGPVRVLLWSQMHGDESTATMALADVLRFLHERPDHPLARRIARGATVHMLPMLNPDGAERFQRRNAQGIDVNRDARRLQTPEGRILKAVRDDVQPDFGFNLHDQNPATRVGDSDRQAAIALLAPAFNEARDVDDKRRRAMQVAAVLVEAMDPLVGGHVARYDDTFNPRAFGDLMGLWGASTVLIESGGWRDDPQKQHLRQANFVGILSALDAIATGRYEAYDPAVYQTLPPNGRRPPDLLIAGGTVAIPDLPPLTADVMIRYGEPLLRRDGRIDDVGDLEGFEAQDTLRIDGLYLIPERAALDAGGGLAVGAPARFIVAEDAAGERVRFRLEGEPPSELRSTTRAPAPRIPTRP